MSGQSILVHLSNVDHATRLLDLAKSVARSQGGRIIGVYAGAQYIVYPTAGHAIPPEIYLAHLQHSREQGEAIGQVFNRAMEGEAFDSEWRFMDAATGTVADRIMPVARSCDLVIAEMRKARSSDDPFADVGETLALGAGRPVLLAPEAAKIAAPMGEVLLAWDGSREASRAAFDALPLLKAARTVHLATIEEQIDPGTQADVPAADIATTLAGHGVTCTTRRVTRNRGSVGEALLRTAAETGADLIVMGAYGHSRLREFVFGGATREIFRAAPVPVFVSH